MRDFDIVIVGGGMVGASTACLLADAGLSVAVIEARKPQAFASEQAMDLRVSAISMGSVELLKSAGVWQAILAMRTCEYTRLETWQVGGDKLSFSAAEINQTSLGYIVENRIIQLALWDKLASANNITLFCPNKLSNITNHDDSITCILDDGTELSAKLALACDGANSRVRQLAGIGISGWDYKQHCMLINISTLFEQQDITWQEFSPTGPRSFLPLAGHNASLVWYHQANEISRLSKLNYIDLKTEVKKVFPQLPGDFTITNAGSFPLTRRHAKQYHRNRVVLLGDAAHTINPLAGQGVNLGFKDVASLVSLIKTAIKDKQSWSSLALQKAYQSERRIDNLLMQSTMDLCYFSFSNNSKPLSFIRNQALKLANKGGVLKRAALRYAMGIGNS